MKLSRYHSKRKFSETPEPQDGAPSESQRLYVIQKHAASHLHYDFRLEHRGVLLSWAVPKGPSLDMGVKRLAVHVEDHPVSYGNFEGTIPKGNYGAGTVEIWDRGSWEPLGNVDDMLAEGVLKFKLNGERLHGKWALVRMTSDDKNWLLIKERDAYARSGDANHVLERHNSAEAKVDFREFRPQLAELSDTIPTSDDWLHEIKYDGYRILAWRTDDGVHLITRSGLDWTHRFPAIAQAVQDYLNPGTGIDGEIVTFGTDGTSDFGALQQWLKDGSGSDPQYVIFDLIQLNHKDLTRQPLIERKNALKTLLDHLPKESSYWLRFSDFVIGHGASMVQEACKKGLEGIVSKSVDSPYLQERSSTWLKSKCVRQDEFVVGGFTAPTGTRHGFGSLLLGQYNPAGQLVYAGRVGSGFDEDTLKSLSSTFKKNLVKDSPFTDPRKIPEFEQWVAPTVVVQVRYSERTKSGLLRHPVFLGIREDKQAGEVTPEETMRDLPISITHPERMLFPFAGLTKLDLAHYYDSVADQILPFLADRPLAIVRCPDGVSNKCFFQKHRGPGMPESIGKTADGEEMLRIQSREDLLSLVQFGAIELHAWQSTFAHIEQPDMMVLDLDPGEGVSWSTVTEAAKVLREYLNSLELPSFPKISGGKGIHVVVPIRRGSLDWDSFKDLARAISESLDSMVPGQFVTTATKSKRAKKIFIDYLRNGRGATSIVPYSARANEDAAVSVAIDWERLSTIHSPRDFAIKNCRDWLPEYKDAWAGFEKSAVKPGKALLAKLPVQPKHVNR